MEMAIVDGMRCEITQYAIHISDNRPSQRWWRLC